MVVPREVKRAAQDGDLLEIERWFWFSDRRDPDEEDEDGRSLLYTATHNGHWEVVRFLLAQGADPNKPGVTMTPLKLAATFGRRDIAVLLLDAGADVDPRDRQGWTPLMSAADRGHVDMIRLLLSRGAALDAKCDNIDETHYAERIARFHTSINSQSKYGRAVAVLADVRAAGGWRAYVRAPRVRLLAYRLFCEEGKAIAPAGTSVLWP